MSQQNVQALAKKMYFEEEFFLAVVRNPQKAMKSFGAGAFTAAEEQQIVAFAAQQTAQIAAAVDQLGGGGVVDLGNGGCGVWC